jgi:hypothetical protein
VEIPDDEAAGTDLTNGELIGISVLLTHSGEPDDMNVYWRARQKIQPLVLAALDHDA